MIVVELRRVPEGSREYHTVAALAVDEQGTYHFEDPEELFPVELPVLIPEDAGLRRVPFEEDPATWARNLDSVLRTGYLVPVVTEDTSPAVSATD